jgi:hypothetical protein
VTALTAGSGGMTVSGATEVRERAWVKKLLSVARERGA